MARSCGQLDELRRLELARLRRARSRRRTCRAARRRPCARRSRAPGSGRTTTGRSASIASWAMLDQLFGDVVAADLLEVAVAEVEAPAGVERRGQRVPVPLALVFVVGQVLVDGVEHLRLGHAAGFVDGDPLGVVEIGVAKVLGVELHVEQVAGRGGERLAAVGRVEEPRRGARRPAGRSSR